MKISSLNYEFDDQLSMKDFFNKNLSDSDINFNGKFIYGTSFGNENPDFNTFPKGMTGVTFVNCNLDNLIIPEGNTVIYTNGLSQRRYKVQNDMNYWLIDEKNNPIIPLNYDIFNKFKLPIPDPKDIPSETVIEAIDLIAKAKELKITE